MKLSILLAGVSLLASEALAGGVSNVAGTLDTTLVDPAPELYPHFICASGCSGGSGGGGAVAQSGAWSVGVSNFPAVQSVNGTVTVPGVASAANQPSINIDGGSLAHITNLPSIQPVSGTVSIANLPASQAVTGTVSVGNFPATQAVTGSVLVPGVASAANQAALNADGGSLAHITNLPSIQPVSGTISIANLPVSQPVTGTVSVGNFPAIQTVNGSVMVPGVATAAGQPALNSDGGGLSHITNFPAVQPVNGAVSISNFPSTQAVSIAADGLGAVIKPAYTAASLADPALVVALSPTSGITAFGAGGQLLMTQTGGTVGLVAGSAQIGHVVVDSGSTIAVPGVATAANQPGLNGDGGALAHVINWPAIQNVSGTVTIGTSVGFGAAGNPSPYVETVQGVPGGTPVGVGLADGADTTMGSKSDAAAGTGSTSIVALLKQLHLDSSGSIPAGPNTIGIVNLGSQTVYNTPVKSTTVESTHVLKASAGQLTSAYVVSGVTGYLMTFDATSAPPDGAVTPTECVPVPANVATGIAFSGLPPENYVNGITAVFSTTGCFTKTASATAFFHGAVQ